MSGLRIALTGNLTSPFSSENEYRRSFEDMGHEVHTFAERGANFQTLASTIRDLDADVVIWVRTPGWHTDLDSQRAYLRSMERAHIPTVAIHLDRYWDLKRESDIRESPWWRQAYIFSADGGNQDRFKAAGIRHYWMKPGVYSGACDVPGAHRNNMASDVIFVGSWHAYHEEWPYRRQLLQFLTTTYRRRFRAWPRGRSIRGPELADLYASAKVVIGDSIFADKAEKYVSDRPFEVVGRGGFLIQPTMIGMDDFTDGEHLRFYTVGDFVELRHLVDYYLHPEHDAERRSIAEAGRAHVKATGTYAHRLQGVLDVLSADRAIRSYDAVPQTPAPYEAPPESPAPVRVRSTRPVRMSRTAQRMLAISRGPSDDMVVKEVWEEDAYRLANTTLVGQTVIDIGANIGAFAMRACEIGAVNVVCYEPLPSNVAHLRKVASASNGFSSRIIVHHMAVGGEAEEVYVREGDNNVWSGSWTGAAEEYGQAVPQTTLDAILDTFTDVGFLKIDTEGAEYDILTAVDPSSLAKVRRIAIEFHAGHHAPSNRDIDSSAFGDILTMLAEVFALETWGHPSRGCMVFGRRY